MMVIAPTARSPPYLERLDVKLMERILSVESMTKVEIPSARQGRIMSLRCLLYTSRQAGKIIERKKEKASVSSTGEETV